LHGTVPLCVDLDGTLIRSDLLVESAIVLLKRNILRLLQFPIWLLRGKAHFKQKLADLVDPAVDLLPYHEPFLQFLKDQKAQGRMLVLATSSNRKYADEVARYLGLFDRVMASDSSTNLGGSRKGRQLVEAFGPGRFDYAANAAVDLEVWCHARKAILVETSTGVAKKAEKLIPVERVFTRRGLGFSGMMKAIRIHQWLKNLLVFVPLITSHQLDDPARLMQAAIAFLAFGLCASSAYLTNDLLDLPADRQHPGKRNRPLASGGLPIMAGIVAVPVLFAAAMVIALTLPGGVIALLVAYYFITLSYSLWLKAQLVVDVLVLAGLYTMRLIVGGAATGITLSFWLLGFAMFLFLSLALLKRYSELLLSSRRKLDSVQGRDYRSEDLEGLAQFGAVSGYLSVLVLALYINSEEVNALYEYPRLIWLLCPLLLYWISRIWLLARRDQMHEDPVVFAMKDRISYWVGLIALSILWIAS
jgi:4-hydroxybenzoate polyprenyltransferase